MSEALQNLSLVEIANALLLERGGQPDGQKLAYPFIVFVQQKLKNA